MKQGWEIRPFEKCIEKVKYTTKIATCDYSTMGAYPVVSQEEEYISGYWNNAEDVFRVSTQPSLQPQLIWLTISSLPMTEYLSSML